MSAAEHLANAEAARTLAAKMREAGCATVGEYFDWLQQQEKDA